MQNDPTEAAILKIKALLEPKMGRTYYNFDEFKIYEVGYPVGDDAAYFVFIDGQRHYFKTLSQAKFYLARVQAP